MNKPRLFVFKPPTEPVGQGQFGDWAPGDEESERESPKRDRFALDSDQWVRIVKWIEASGGSALTTDELYTSFRAARLPELSRVPLEAFSEAARIARRHMSNCGEVHP